MDTLEQGKVSIINGIERDAKVEAEKILSDAKKHAEERVQNGERQVQSILKDAGIKAQEQSEVVKKRLLAGLAIEVKRRRMQVQEQLIDEVLYRVKDELAAMIQRPEYPDIILSWIVEAMVGLGVIRAMVNASKMEREIIAKRLLRVAEERVKAQTDKTVQLELSKDAALNSQGVVLTAEDGKTAYNNQVSVRLLRKQNEIRKLIYDRLFITSGSSKK